MTRHTADGSAALLRPGTRRTRNWRNPAVRSLVYQIATVLALGALLLWLVHNTRVNMTARSMQSGFDFLAQTAGFDIGEGLISYKPSDPYWRAFLVGFLNTVQVAMISIVLSTAVGIALGMGRLSPNALMRAFITCYTEIFRNVPLLVQLLLWYVALLACLPDTSQALSLPGGVFLSTAGLSFPWFTSSPDGFVWTQPTMNGFSFDGGAALSPEYLAVVFGLVCYSSAFIGEIVRAGIASVPHGQLEASQSIGLSKIQTMRRVVLPQALRMMVPPLSNQYLALTKNSSLAVAIGYPDLVSIAGTALNQTGRAIECISILMAIYLLLSLVMSAAMNAWNRRAALKER